MLGTRLLPPSLAPFLFALTTFLGVLVPRQGHSEGTVRLAVIEFESASSDKELAPLGKGLQSMLTTDLTGVPGVQVIERQQLKGVLAELDLAKSGAKGRMDKSTVAKIGKLAGASRLLGGSFTVVGGKMRLDGRLYSVETGEVLTAAAIDGDKDAFFELEKQLAQKVVDALGIVLKPKERAVLTKVHTADFDAFQSFSRGLAAFDDKRYQDALTALGDATRRDKDFVLAARTRDEYEKLIGQLRDRADTMAQNAEAEADAKARREQAAHSAKWGATIEALWKIAGASGGGQTQLDRLAALFLLAAGYEYGFQLRFPRGDAFALERTSDELEKRYFTEAKELFPRIPPYVVSSVFSEPKKDETIEAWVRRTFEAMERQMSPAHMGGIREMMSRNISDLMGSPSGLSKRLQLDARSGLRLMEQLADWGEALDPKHGFRAWMRHLMADVYRSELELERSTALYAAPSDDAKSPHQLRLIANQVEDNKRLHTLLAEAKNPWVKELLLLGGLNMEKVVTSYFGGATPTKEGLRYLASARSLSTRNLMFVDEVPTWLMRAGREGDLQTGPRSDKRRTTELRYYPSVVDRIRDPHYDQMPEALVITGARPRQDGTLGFKVSFTLPADLDRDDVGKPKGKGDKNGNTSERPRVGVAFGVQYAQGVDPTTGYVLLVGASECEVASFALTKIKDEARINKVRTEMVLTSMSKRACAGLAATDAVVSVRFADKTAELTVGGKKTTLDIPAEGNGFQGLFFKDLGYVAISRLVSK